MTAAQETRAVTAAVAVIDGEEHEYDLIPTCGEYRWMAPDGDLMGWAASGTTPAAALRNLEIKLRDEEPGFQSLHWA